MSKTGRLLALAIVAGAIQTSLAAGTPPAGASGPRLEVPETSFDYGYTIQNSKIAHVYWLKNTGNDTLRLNNVRPGCGCTKAPLKKKNLVPGDSTDVEIVFSTGEYSSSVRKTSEILMMSPGPPPPVLTFSACPTPKPDSLRPLTFNPMRVSLDSLKKAAVPAPWDVSINVKNWSGRDLKIRQVSPALEHIQVAAPKAGIGAEKEATLHIRIDPVLADTTFAKSITFEVSDSSHTRYTLPIIKEAPVVPGAAPVH